MLWSKEIEFEVGHRILRAEQGARDALVGIAAVADLLADSTDGRPSGRAKQARQLEQAVERAAVLRMMEPALYAQVQQAKGSLDEARTLRNLLVRSASNIVIVEARKRLLLPASQRTLIRHGHMGLVRASYGFDPNRGFRFATHARWWVRRRMNRALTSAEPTWH